MILQIGVATIEHFDDTVDLEYVLIEGAPHNKLNPLKKVQPEGFFYWHKAVNIP